MRIFKTAIGVGICFFLFNILSNYFNDEISPFYGAIAVILTMEKTVNLTAKSGLHRIVGTLLGSVVSLIFILAAQKLNIPMLDFLFVFVGIIIIIKLCILFKVPKGIGVSCIIICAVFSMADKPVEYVGYRMIETLAGVFIAIGVNRFLPNDNITNLD